MATFGSILLVALLLALVSVVAALSYRFVAVRGHATPVLARRPDGEWRYGAMRYAAGEAMFYRLVSIRPGADLRIQRRTITLGDRRSPSGAELDLAEQGEIIVPMRGLDRRGGTVEMELCLDAQALTALLSWVEACSTEDVRHVHHRQRASTSRRRDQPSQ